MANLVCKVCGNDTADSKCPFYRNIFGGCSHSVNDLEINGCDHICDHPEECPNKEWARRHKEMSFRILLQNGINTPARVIATDTEADLELNYPGLLQYFKHNPDVDALKVIYKDTTQTIIQVIKPIGY